MEKKDMNIVLAVVICLVLAGVLIFISINNKTNMVTENNGVNNDISGTETAETGDTVSVNYTGRLGNGIVH